MNKLTVEKFFKLPLASVLEVRSEELHKEISEMDDFFHKEWYLLNHEIDDIQQNIMYFNSVLTNFKVDRCEKKLLVLNAAKKMVVSKLMEFMTQEQMIVHALKKEFDRIYEDVLKIQRKYNVF